MNLILAEDARNALVQVIASLVDAGGQPGRIELKTIGGQLLSVLKFQFPSAGDASGGQLQFKQIAEDAAARGSGTAELAQIRDSEGRIVFECDVSDAKGDGVIKLNSNVIAAGGPVRLTSFLLTAPK
jgi:hypothetical protein